jgi:hypothetical protein
MNKKNYPFHLRKEKEEGEESEKEINLKNFLTNLINPCFPISQNSKSLFYMNYIDKFNDITNILKKKYVTIFS